MTFASIELKPSFAFRRAIFMVLFAGYLMLAMLVVEQGRTISNQRLLIRALFQDSLELTSLKAHQLQQRR